MRQSRLKAPLGHPVAYYHCLSRVVNRDFVFGPQEKEMFVRLMRRWERFCGVRIVTFCVLSNHFHLLVEVRPRPTQLPTVEELFDLIEGLYGKGGAITLREQWKVVSASGNAEAMGQWQEGFFRRMWDVSAFMKALKQQFTQWFNGRHERCGTLWEERFKSVLVEGAGLALATMAAYIDLNPVRAGLVEDPKEYRWSGYAEAAAGRRLAREGLKTVVRGANRPAGSWREVLAEYRVRLYGEGEQQGSDDLERGVVVRRGLSREEVAAVMARKGRLSAVEMLRCRVRYFADGAVLGTKAFVEEVFQVERDRFGPRRKDGARRMRFVEASELRVLRDLRVQPIG
jgi:putative transposase